jgi:broad specificity phosphatase PhoE
MVDAIVPRRRWGTRIIRNAVWLDWCEVRRVGVVELWLVRHGETVWSAEGKHTSRTDIPLTERGRQRAVVLGEFLAGVEFKAVLRSPMLRARETCELAGFGEVAVVDEGLREWDYGIYEGETTREIQRRVPGWSVWRNEITGGETLEEVGRRADGVIERALEFGDIPTFDAMMPASKMRHPNVARVALFGHAHILRILAARWIGLDAVGGSLLTLGTGSVSVLGWERETRVVQRWNRSFDV